MNLLRNSIAIALLARVLLAQAPPILDTPLYDIVDAFPYLASKAVASDPTTNEIYDGAGGGVIRLAHTSGSLALVSSSPQRFDTGGMAMDIELGSGFAYLAAAGRGLQVRDRANPATQASFSLPGRAWRVATVDVGGGHRLVFVGTHETDVFAHQLKGALHVFDHDTAAPLAETGASQNPKPLGAPIALDAPAWAVAASTGVLFQVPVGNVPVCVIVGVESGPCFTSAPPPLRRLNYAYDASAGGTLLLLSSIAWQGDPSQTPPIGQFVRDCVIDPAHDRAYVAAYWDGVYAFDLQPGLAQIVAADWPIKHLEGTQIGASYANALALDVDPSPTVPARLFVGRGWPLFTETQYIGDCDDVPCNDIQAPAEMSSPVKHYGVAVYALGTTSANSVARETVRETVDAAGERKLTCEALSVRRVDADEYFVDVACDTLGFHVLHGQLGGQSWSLAPDAEWSTEPAPAKLPLHALDDAVIVDQPEGRVMYAATELGVTTFALGGTTSLATANPRLAKNGAIVVSAFANPSGRIVAGTSGGNPLTPGGIRFYDTTNPLTPLAAGSQELHRGGFGYGIAAHPGFDPLRRFVYSVSIRRPDTVEEWAVRCWDIGDATAPIDPSSLPSACTPIPCTQQEPCVSTPQEPICLASFLANSNGMTLDSKLDAIAVVDSPTGEQLAYVLYAPEGRIRFGPAGLLVLDHVVNGSGQSQLNLVTAVPAWNDADFNFRPTRITLHGDLLYAAWATGGVACYDISDRRAPFLIPNGAVTVSARTGNGLRAATTHVIPGPVGAGGDQYLYVAYLNDGVAIYKLSAGGLSIEHAPIPMRFQAITLVPDPDSDHTVYLCGGRAGIDRITFDQSLFP